MDSLESDTSCPGDDVEQQVEVPGVERRQFTVNRTDFFMAPEQIEALACHPNGMINYVEVSPKFDDNLLELIRLATDDVEARIANTRFLGNARLSSYTVPACSEKRKLNASLAKLILMSVLLNLAHETEVKSSSTKLSLPYQGPIAHFGSKENIAYFWLAEKLVEPEAELKNLRLAVEHAGAMFFFHHNRFTNPMYPDVGAIESKRGLHQLNGETGSMLVKAIYSQISVEERLEAFKEAIGLLEEQVEFEKTLVQMFDQNQRGGLIHMKGKIMPHRCPETLEEHVRKKAFYEKLITYCSINLDALSRGGQVVLFPADFTIQPEYENFYHSCLRPALDELQRSGGRS